MLPLLTWEMLGTSLSTGRSLRRSTVLVWRSVHLRFIQLLRTILFIHRPPVPVRGMCRHVPDTLRYEIMQVSPETISATVEEEIVKVQDKLVAERFASAFIDLSSPQQVSQRLVTSGLVQSLLRCLLLQVSLQCQSSAPEDQGSLEIRGRSSHQAGA